MNVLGIFRGFPGLGRVVSGVSILESLRDDYGCSIEIISYLQGNKYLETRGYVGLQESRAMDYCSIGLLPTNKMGRYIYNRIKDSIPDLIIIDGEPLLIESFKISYPNIKIVTLLNPSDVDNPNNDKEAMDYFNALYSMSDLAIVHGLRRAKTQYKYNEILYTPTLLRNEILNINNIPSKNIYCILGGGTVNVDNQFSESTISIALLCQKVAFKLLDYKIHIVCSSQNIYDEINKNKSNYNVILHDRVIDATKYYSDACLVITRSGRNTLSELAYLGIPAISFISGCIYRQAEQEENIKSLQVDNIVSASIDIRVPEMVEICTKLLSANKSNNRFKCGNKIAIEKILNLGN